MSQITIILDDGTRHQVDATDAATARTLADFLAAHGFPLNTRCAKRGLCRGCEVVCDGKGEAVQSCQIPATDVATSLPIPIREYQGENARLISVGNESSG